MNYESSPISELIEEISMGPFGSNIKVECFTESGVPVLNGSNVNGFQLSEESFRYVTPEKAKSLGSAVAHRGDVVITHRGTLGQIVYIPQNSKYQEYVISQSQFRVKCNHKVLPEYMVYYFHTPFGQHELLSNASQVGVPALARPTSTFQKLTLFFPSIDDQKRIVKTLIDIEEQIKTINRINNNLEQQAKALYKSIIESSKQSGLLSDYMNIKHGYAFKGDYISTEDNGIVLVTPGNFRIGGGFQESKCKFFTTDYPEEYVLHPGDLIVTMTDLSKGADTLGYGAIVPDNHDRVYLHNQRIGLVQLRNSHLDKDFIYWYLRSYDYHARIVGSASGSTVKHTSPKRILEQRIPIPQKEDAAKLKLLRFIDAKITKNDLESRKLATVRDTLLPRLISGKIDVSSIAI